MTHAMKRTFYIFINAGHNITSLALVYVQKNGVAKLATPSDSVAGSLRPRHCARC
jgi:hypothetical protein